MSSESPERINADAAAWFARRDGEAWAPSDEDALNAWLETSYRHRVAYLRLEHVWREAGRLKALGAGLPPGEIPAPHARDTFLMARSEEKARGAPECEPRISPADFLVRRLRRAQRRVAAAAVIITLGAGALWWGLPPGSTYQTPIGALETVSIRDGSRVTLNTDSRIDVALTPTERRIELNRGEAFFEVAKDPHRPFVVQAGRTSITAIGTQFSVRRKTTGVEVVVTEGVVRVANGAATTAERGQPVRAGEIARIGEGGVLVQVTSQPVAEAELSWRSGVLVFRDALLSEAVAEFNRYNIRKIVIASPALADFHVAGTFKATSSEAFVHLLEQGFPIRVEERGDAYVLDSRK